MATSWVKSVDDHPAWGAVSLVQTALGRIVLTDEDSWDVRQDIDRVRAALNFIDMRLKKAHSALVPKSALETIAVHLAGAGEELLGFASNHGANHINNANAQLDEVLIALGRVALPDTPADMESLGAASRGFRKATEEQFAAAQNERERASAHATELGTALAELEESIDEQQKHLDGVAATFVKQFSDAQETRVVDFAAAQEERRQKFEDVKKQITTTVTTLEVQQREALESLEKATALTVGITRTKMENEASTLLHRLGKRETEVDELVGIIGNKAVTANYVQAANEARATMRNWQRATLLGFLIWIAFAFKAFLPALTHSETLDWAGIIGRIVLTVTAGFLVAYCSTQGDRFLQLEHHNRRLALELQALGPFLASLPEADQKEFRLKIGDRIFGRQDLQFIADKSPTNVLDLINDKRFKSAVETVQKLIPGQNTEKG